MKPRQGRNLKHKSWYKGGVLPMSSCVKVEAGHQTKHTVASKGADPIFSEVLEFMLGAPTWAWVVYSRSSAA